MMKKNSFKFVIIATVSLVIVLATVMILRKQGKSVKDVSKGSMSSTLLYPEDRFDPGPGNSSNVIKEAKEMPVYGQWRNFTTNDGLPSDKVYAVKTDGDRVWAGTHDGLALYENGKWRTYTTGDGLAHNGVVSVDVSEITGDVWIGTLGGLSRLSEGKFETFNQFNSGLPNDLVYNVCCYGNDVWVATGGGAGRYETRTKQWEIFTELNAPMHEPWTYAISGGEGKVWIAAWGGGVIEYNPQTKKFRDHTDPDGFMEIDLQPNDGLVHDITTATSYANGIVWVSSYFGMSRYDGKNWNGYFNHDSGLASNFINYLTAKGPVVYVCSDNGFSTFNGETWVTYIKNDNDENGKAIITNGTEKKEVPLSPSISHNFIIGADAQDDVVWVATSKGVCRGEVLR